MNKLLPKVLVMLLVVVSLTNQIAASTIQENTSKEFTEDSYSATVSESVYDMVTETPTEAPTAIPTATPSATPPTATPSATPPTATLAVTPAMTNDAGGSVGDDYGNDFNTAANLEFNSQTTGVIDSTSDIDCFSFVTDKSGVYIIESSAVGEANLEIYDSEGICIASDNISTDYSFYLDMSLNSNEIFYIQIGSTQNNVPYSVKVDMVDDDHGYNISSATEIVFNKEVSGQINYSNDTDYFKITPDTDGLYSLECSGTEQSYLFLNDSYGRCINSGDFSSSNVFIYDFDLNSNETYYLHVVSGINGATYKVKMSQRSLQSSELLQNPSFSDNTAGWYFWKEGGAEASGARDTEVYESANAGYRIDCTSNGSAANHIQLFTSGINVQAGKTYKLSFMAKSEAGSSSASIQLMKKNSPWTSYAKATMVTIGSEWTMYNVYITSNTTDSDGRITFFLGNRIPEGGKLYIDSLSLKEYSELLINPSFDNDTKGWGFWTENGAAAIGSRDTVEYDSASAGYSVACTSTGSLPNHIQLYTSGIKVEAGKKYKLNFKAKSEGGDSTPLLSLMQKSSPWKSYASVRTLTIGSEWTTYQVFFDCNSSDDNARLTFYLGNRMPAGSTLYLDSLSLVEVQ